MNYRQPKPKKKLATDATLGQMQRVRRAGRITEAQVRALYSSALTLGAGEQERLAHDNALQDAGVFGLIQHSINLGQMPLITFLGYAALQQIEQNSLIRTLIQTPVRDMMQSGFELTVDTREDESDYLYSIYPELQQDQQTKAIATIESKWQEFKLDRLLSRALEMDGYEGGAFIFIDTGAQGSDLLLPLDISEHSIELQQSRKLAFKLIDPINCFPGVYNASEPLGDYYFDPQTFWILGTQVHKSRLIKFAANEVPLLLKPAYNFLGIPQAQLYWDFVIHWNQNRESINRLLNKFSLTAFKTDLADVLGGGLADDLNRRIDYLAEKRNNDGILLMDKEREDVINISTPLSGVTDIVKQSLETLAVVSHIPAVVLFGQSPQGFNATGESDLKNYSNLIEARRKYEMLEPIQTIVDILRLKFTSLKDTVKVKFLPFDTSKTAQDAMTELTKAQTAAARIQAGITTADEERQKLANDRESSMQWLDLDAEPEEVGGDGGTLPDDFMQSALNQNQENEQSNEQSEKASEEA